MSSIVLVTEKGPGGEAVTRTSYTFVEPAGVTGESGEQASQTSARPGLQTGAAVKGRDGTMNAGLWGAVGVVAMLI